MFSDHDIRIAFTNVWDGAYLVTDPNTKRFFKNAQISRRNLSFWLKGLGCCFSNEV